MFHTEEIKNVRMHGFPVTYQLVSVPERKAWDDEDRLAQEAISGDVYSKISILSIKPYSLRLPLKDASTYDRQWCMYTVSQKLTRFAIVNIFYSSMSLRLLYLAETVNVGLERTGNLE